VVYHDASGRSVSGPRDYADHADQLVEKYGRESGYWGSSGRGLDTSRPARDIRYERYRCVYGVDHIKKAATHGADNYDCVGGHRARTRESRRLVGDAS
jgi:hypothetical protein